MLVLRPSSLFLLLPLSSSRGTLPRGRDFFLFCFVAVSMAVSTSSVAEVSDCPAFEHAVLLGMVSRRRYLRLLSSFFLPPAPARIKMVDLGASLIFLVPDGRLIVRAVLICSSSGFSSRVICVVWESPATDWLLRWSPTQPVFDCTCVNNFSCVPRSSHFFQIRIHR